MRPRGRPKGLGLQSLILQDWNIPPSPLVWCGVGGYIPPPSCGGGGDLYGYIPFLVNPNFLRVWRRGGGELSEK